MALTITEVSRTVFGNKRVGIFDIAFDSSYPFGGESLTPTDLGFFSIDYLRGSAKVGYDFDYDYSNQKLKALRQGTNRPQLVTEEALTVATNVGTLTHVPLYIVAVHVTAGNVTGAFNVIPTGETPLTKQVDVNFLTGVMTFLSTDIVTAASITYIPKQDVGPFISSTLVIDEEVTAAAAKADLANQACAVQYVYDSTDGVIAALEPVGEAPSATHTAVIDIDAGSDDTNIDSHADDEGNTLKVTYLKYAPVIPTALCIGDGDLTLASEAYDWTKSGGYHGLVIPGLGTQGVGEEVGNGNEIVTWEGPSGTAGNTVGTWNPEKNYFLTNNTNAIVTLAMPFFVIDRTLNVEAAEVAEAVDLSGLTSVRIFCFGC